MGRPLRIFIPGYAYHIIARGNERKDIFRDDEDRKKILQIMEEAKEKYQFIVFAYVLMSNHYHFLAEIKMPNMSQAMQFINTSYGIYFNRKYKRSGHFLQGRFQAIIVEHGQDLKFVMAYIHLNPARAGMVEKLIDYRWSSHRQYTGGMGNGIAEPENVLKYFSENRGEAVKKYEKYIKQVAIEPNDEKNARIYGDYVMGSENFVRKIKLMFKGKKLSQAIVKRKKLRKIYEPAAVIKAVMKFYNIIEKELLYKKGKWNRGKRILIYLLGSDAGMQYSSIGRMLGDLHASSVGRVFKKVALENMRSGKTQREIARTRKIYMEG